MAITSLANKIYVDSTGVVTDSRTKVAYILFTPSAANDSVTFKETSGGSDILFIQGATAKTTMQIRFEDVPMLFNSIYVSQISSGAKMTIVTTSAGA